MRKNFNSSGRLSTVEAQAGFIQIVLLVLVALILLKYIYSIDVIEFLTNFAENIWGKYGDNLFKIWNYVVTFIKSLISKIK